MIDILLHIFGWTIGVLLIIGFIGALYKSFKTAFGD